MRQLLICLCTLLGPATVQAQTLDEAQRAQLLKKLSAIEESAQRQVDGRFRSAIGDFEQAISSNEAAIDLYLKCTEKVNFTDQLKDGKEFREWKASNEGHYNTPAFKLALRYQLKWLMLMMQSASKNADHDALAVAAMKHVDTIYGNIDEVRAQSKTLKQSALSSVFAQAYGIQKLDSKWPASPTELKDVFDTIILPPLRHPARIKELRAAWDRRLQLEALDAVEWGEAPKAGRKDREAREQIRDGRTLKQEKYLSETRPQLLWEKELDLFKCGDQSGAATRMIEHIGGNASHSSSERWIRQLKDLLSEGTTGK